MNGLIFSCLVLFVCLYHILVRFAMKKGKIREGYCALWVGDLLFSIFGTVITLTMYHFSFLPFLTLRTLLFMIAFLLITVLLLVLGPNGFRILGSRPALSEEEVIRAEYRFNDTLGIIRNLFLLMLFLIPVFFAVSIQFPEYFTFLSGFGEGELCSVFCLITFLTLLPICLRQTIFWLKNVTYSSVPAESDLLRMEQARLYYRQRNIRI